MRKFFHYDILTHYVYIRLVSNFDMQLTREMRSENDYCEKESITISKYLSIFNIDYLHDINSIVCANK